MKELREKEAFCFGKSPYFLNDPRMCARVYMYIYTYIWSLSLLMAIPR